MTDRVPVVSVVVPVREDADDIGAAVASILAQEGVGDVEVLVAVGPSADGTAEVVARLAARDPRVHVIENPAGSAAAGLNLALRASRADVVARVDARSILPPGYLSRAVETLHRTGAGNVGGRQEPVGRTPIERAIAVALRSRAGSGGARYRVGGGEGPVDTVYLGVFRRAALEQVGGFDESLDRNQDYELNWRLRQHGWQVWFDPMLSVTYRPRPTVAALARQYWWFGRWKRVVLRRHPGSARARQLAPPAVTAAVVIGLAAAPWRRRALVVPGAYLAGVTITGLAAGSREAPSVRLRVPVVTATMHLAWGAGFLWPQVQRRQAPRSSPNIASSSSTSAA